MTRGALNSCARTTTTTTTSPSQAVTCPAGFICTPIGTPTTVKCPDGYVCTAIPATSVTNPTAYTSPAPTASTGSITITDVQYSPAYPKVDDWITTNVTVVNNSSVNQSTPFEVVVQGTAVTVPSLAAGAKTTVTVPNAFSFSYPGKETLNTVIVYPIIGNPGSGNTGNMFTNTLTFTSVPYSSPLPLTTVCPAGYICNPPNVLATCPAGYTCTSATLNCPSGYTCYTYVLTSSGQPTISSISTSYANPGTQVTVYGNNFSISYSNSISLTNSTHDTGVSGITSTDGKSVKFTVADLSQISAGTYNLAVENTSGQRSNSVQFTIVAPYTSPTLTPTPTSAPSSAAPYVRLSVASGDLTSDSSMSVNVGNVFTISGTPQNLQGLSYNGSASASTPNSFAMAYFFNQTFGNGNSCGNNNSTANGPWIMTCTAKLPASSYFYVEIYKGGQTYRSNVVYVNVNPSANPTPTPVPTVTPVPTATPYATPTAAPATSAIPSINASASLTSRTSNYAGTWGAFAPGSYGSNPNDWGWTLNTSMASAKAISSIDINTSQGDWWSTSNQSFFPLVVFKSGVQQNTAYGQTISVNPNSQLQLYGQQVSTQWGGGTLRISFTDGTSATANIPASTLTSSAVDQNSLNASIWDAVKEYFNRQQ